MKDWSMWRAFCVLCILFSTGCAANADHAPEEQPADAIEAPLFYAADTAHTKWPKGAGHNTTAGADIHTCYKYTGTPWYGGAMDAKTNAEKAARKQFAQRAVEIMRQTWGRAADINYYDDGACPANTDDKYVLYIVNHNDTCPMDPLDNTPMACNDFCPPVGTVRDCNAPVDGCGSVRLPANPPGSHPTCVTTKSTDPGCCTWANTTSLGYFPPPCNRTDGLACNSSRLDMFSDEPLTIVHEAGHALGFGHEHERPDWNGGTGSLGANQAYLTTVDFDSVMSEGYVDNYLSWNRNANLPADPTHTLSALDVIGVQKKYGTKPVGSAVTSSGRCLTFDGNAAINSPVIDYNCLGDNTDTFGMPLVATGLRELRTTIGSTLECMNLRGGNPHPGIPNSLIAYTCAFYSNGNEQFDFSGMRLRAMGNMCVAVTSASADAQVELRKCLSYDPTTHAEIPLDETLSHWTLDGKRIRLTNTNLCMSFQTGNPVRGQLLSLAACADTAVQNFGFSQGKVTVNSLCMNVFGGKTSEHSRIGLYDGCNSGLPNTQFYLSGPLKMMSKCVSPSGGAWFNKDPAVMDDCGPLFRGDPPAAQEFDFHW